jgi:hypothetical protein
MTSLATLILFLFRFTLFRVVRLSVSEHLSVRRMPMILLGISRFSILPVTLSTVEFGALRSDARDLIGIFNRLASEKNNEMTIVKCTIES